MQQNTAICNEYQHYCHLGCACIVWQIGTNVAEELTASIHRADEFLRWRLQITPNCQYLAAKICCIASQKTAILPALADFQLRTTTLHVSMTQATSSKQNIKC